MRSTDLSWEEQTRADAGRLWAGGVVTALVAAGVALIALMVLHRVLHAPILSPGGLHEAADYAMIAFPVAVAIVTLLATGLLHLLMETTPRASQFFAWIGALVLALVVLQVFLHQTDLLTKAETAAFYLLVGIAIISSLRGVSSSAVRYQRHQSYRESHPNAPAYGPNDAPYREGRSNAAAYGYPNDRAYRDEPWR
jgi:fucose 4-O-acetylase-like acetyltransferase